MPVIIITGFPSTESAIASIDLPVAAYLRKPVQWDDLLARIEAAIGRFRVYRSMRRTEEQLEALRDEFRQVTSPNQVVKSAGGAQVDAFLALTLRNVMGSLSSLESLGHALGGRPVAGTPCQLINCPRGLQLQQALRETIAVLEETKGAFKSKTLANLREIGAVVGDGLMRSAAFLLTSRVLVLACLQAGLPRHPDRQAW